MATTASYAPEELRPRASELRATGDIPTPRGRPGDRRIRLTVLLLLVSLLFLLLPGCGVGPSPVSKVIVVLASATANEPGPVLATDDRARLHAAGDTSTDGIAYIVNPNTGQATQVPLTPRRPDGQVQYTQPQRNNTLAGNVTQVQRVLDRQAATRPFDLLTMINDAVRVSSSPGTLIVLSSGLSTAGGLDLRQVGWGANPAAVAAQLRQRRLLPNLTGWNVIFSGLGVTATPQPALPLPQQTILTSYWMAICRAAGAATCGTDDMTRPQPPARSSVPVPIVPVPVVTSVRGPHGWTGKNIPADEFFAFNSALLLPGADAVLVPLAARARAEHALISITGYASPDAGSASYNESLSQRRALAVHDRLIALGVLPGQIIRMRGLGTDGEPRSACLVQGQLDEAICAQFRRVVVLLSAAPATTS